MLPNAYGQPGSFDWFSVAPFIFGISLVLTLPCALLIGAPLTWPFRDWIARRPGPATLVFGTIGAAAGRAATWLLITQANVSALIDWNCLIGATFGALTTIAFVWIIRLTRPRPVRDDFDYGQL